MDEHQPGLLAWYHARMSIRTLLFASVALIGFQVLVLYLMGQSVICECGVVKLWEGVVTSSGTSQHITDWYTFSHVIHGVLFFLALSYFFPRMSLGAKLLIAIALEVGWEILENTPMVIEHYRQQALARGYVGDSILNSASDTLAMVAGFFFSARFSWWIVVPIMLAFEVFTLYMIKDSLLLNIVGFVAPDLFASWQSQ